MAIMHTLRIDHDNKNQMIWFSGALADGHKFSVGFPIAHIKVTFDEQAGSLGWCGEPLCGYVETIEGFFGNIEAGLKSGGPVADIMRSAQTQTMKTAGTQALHYGTAAAQLVKSQRGTVGQRASHALPAIGAHGLAAMHAAHLAVKRQQAGQDVSKMQSAMRAMIANPGDPIARITLAALQSQQV
jgi:hypothetical protein